MLRGAQEPHQAFSSLTASGAAIPRGRTKGGAHALLGLLGLLVAGAAAGRPPLPHGPRAGSSLETWRVGGDVLAGRWLPLP